MTEINDLIEENRILKEKLDSINYKLDLAIDEFGLLKYEEFASKLIDTIFYDEFYELYTCENNFQDLNLMTNELELIAELTKEYKKIYHLRFYCMEIFICSKDKDKITIYKIRDEEKTEKYEFDYDFDDLTQNDLCYIVYDLFTNYHSIEYYLSEK